MHDAHLDRASLQGSVSSRSGRRLSVVCAHVLDGDHGGLRGPGRQRWRCWRVVTPENSRAHGQQNRPADFAQHALTLANLEPSGSGKVTLGRQNVEAAIAAASPGGKSSRGKAGDHAPNSSLGSGAVPEDVVTGQAVEIERGRRVLSADAWSTRRPTARAVRPPDAITSGSWTVPEDVVVAVPVEVARERIVARP